MEHEEIMQRYVELFEEDPLYQYIKKNKRLYKELIAPAEIYNEIYFDSTCSTAQAATVLGIAGKQQTLLNFLAREDFEDYFNLERKGERGYYRFDYKSLFQFKMILLLVGDQLSPLDIATLIGTSATYSYTEKPQRRGEHLPSNRGLSKEEVEDLFNEKFYKMAEVMTKQSQFYKKELETTNYINDLKIQENQLKNDLRHWESDMKHNSLEIEKLEVEIEALQVKPEMEQGIVSKLLGIRLNTKSKEIEEILRKKKEMKEKLIDERQLIETNKLRISKELEAKSQLLLDTVNKSLAGENPNLMESLEITSDETPEKEPEEVESE